MNLHLYAQVLDEAIASHAFPIYGKSQFLPTGRTHVNKYFSSLSIDEQLIHKYRLLRQHHNAPSA